MRLALVLRGFLIAVIVCLGFGNAQAADDDWLVGHWEGHDTKNANDKRHFVLDVAGVKSDQSFIAQWTVDAKASSGQGKIDGNGVTVAFKNGNNVSLFRASDGSLAGSTTPENGGPGIALVFVKGSGQCHGCDSAGCCRVGQNLRLPPTGAERAGSDHACQQWRCRRDARGAGEMRQRPHDARQLAMRRFFAAAIALVAVAVDPLIAHAADAAPNFVPPPRSIADITAILNQEKPDAAKIAKSTAAADAQPPAGLDDKAMIEFLMPRGDAAAALGRSQQALTDLRKAVEMSKAHPGDMATIIGAHRPNCRAAERRAGNIAAMLQAMQEASADALASQQRMATLFPTYRDLAVQAVSLARRISGRVVEKARSGLG